MMFSPESIMTVLLILAGLYMAWNIGANDVANAMGTSVGSGALTLRRAVVIAGILEFSGAYFFGAHVSETIQSGIVDSSVFVHQPMRLVLGMFASLLSAGIWLQIASYKGWPVSTTHTIVGAVIGFGAIVGGIDAVHWENVLYIVSSWVISPILGAILSFVIFNFLRRKIFYSKDPVLAAKKITPGLTFLVAFTLSQTLIYNGFKNFDLHLALWQSILMSLILSSVFAFVAYLLLKRIHVKQYAQAKITVDNPEISLRIQKATRHLEQLKGITSGMTQEKTDQLIREIQELSDQVPEKENTSKEHSEFAIVERIFSYLQIASACLMAFAHGANDVANAIGPLSAGLQVLTVGTLTENTPVPPWILALGGFGIVIGLATWGWRVIETIGKKITELTPTRGFAAEFGAAATILLASRLGLPISTTHTLVGSVIGVGLARGIQSIDLGTTREIFLSWCVTVPAGAIIAIAIFYPMSLWLAG